MLLMVCSFCFAILWRRRKSKKDQTKIAVEEEGNGVCVLENGVGGGGGGGLCGELGGLGSGPDAVVNTDRRSVHTSTNDNNHHEDAMVIARTALLRASDLLGAAALTLEGYGDSYGYGSGGHDSDGGSLHRSIHRSPANKPSDHVHLPPLVGVASSFATPTPMLAMKKGYGTSSKKTYVSTSSLGDLARDTDSMITHDLDHRVARDIAHYLTRDAAQDITHDMDNHTAQGISHHTTYDAALDITDDMAHHITRDAAQDITHAMANHTTYHAALDITDDIAHHIIRDAAQDAAISVSHVPYKETDTVGGGWGNLSTQDKEDQVAAVEAGDKQQETTQQLTQPDSLQRQRQDDDEGTHEAVERTIASARLNTPAQRTLSTHPLAPHPVLDVTIAGQDRLLSLEEMNSPTPKEQPVALPLLSEALPLVSGALPLLSVSLPLQSVALPLQSESLLLLDTTPREVPVELTVVDTAPKGIAVSILDDNVAVAKHDVNDAAVAVTNNNNADCDGGAITNNYLVDDNAPAKLVSYSTLTSDPGVSVMRNNPGKFPTDVDVPMIDTKGVGTKCTNGIPAVISDGSALLSMDKKDGDGDGDANATTENADAPTSIVAPAAANKAPVAKGPNGKVKMTMREFTVLSQGVYEGIHALVGMMSPVHYTSYQFILSTHPFNTIDTSPHPYYCPHHYPNAIIVHITPSLSIIVLLNHPTSIVIIITPSLLLSSSFTH